METVPAPQDVALTGQVMLYAKPELLSKEVHGNLGVNPAPTRFGFAAKTHVCPLTVPEFGPASLAYRRLKVITFRSAGAAGPASRSIADCGGNAARGVGKGMAASGGVGGGNVARGVGGGLAGRSRPASPPAS